MPSESPRYAVSTETMTFPVAPGKPTVSVEIPTGSLPHAASILDMIAPVISPAARTRVYPEGQDWRVEEQISLAAIATLPQRTREMLLAEYPAASTASLPHIVHAVHSRCYAAWLHLAESLPAGGAESLAPAAA